jgi:hypothetical protein
MNTEHLALVRGWADTRATLRRWQTRPAGVVAPWAAGSLCVAAVLLVATWVVARLSMPDPDPFELVGTGRLGGWSDYGWILYRNSLVLALHAMACVAGFMAGSSLPVVAEGYSGLWRRIHDHAGRIAIGFVVCATLFSLATQAYGLGRDLSTQAADRHMSPALVLVGVLPHAVPELCALFLPLAAWIMASRRGAWEELLAATFVTTGIAVPILLVAAAIEIRVTPHVLYFLK